MPERVSSNLSLSTPSTRNTPQTAYRAQEIPQPEFESGSFNTYAHSSTSKSPKITATNILGLQRTIGNQAVQRLIQRQKAPASSPLDPAVLSRKPQVTTAGLNSADSKLPQPGADRRDASVPASFTIQRLSTKENIKERSNSGADGDSFTSLLEKVDFYHNSIKHKDNKVKTTQGERLVQVNLLTNILDEITSLAKTYLENHANKKSNILGADRAKTVSTVEKIDMEVTLEKADLLTVANKPRVYDADITKNPTWDAALQDIQNSLVFKGNLNVQIVNDLEELGLPVAYAKTLDKVVLTLISRANKAMSDGNLGGADALLVDLQQRLSAGAYGLIKSTLMFKHLGEINPELAAVLNNPKYEQKDDKMAQKGHELAGGAEQTGEFNANLDRFKGHLKTGGETAGEDDQFRRAALTQETTKDKVKGNWLNRLKWEKENVKTKKFENLKDHEKSSLAQYSNKYKMFNVPLRGDLKPLPKDEQQLPELPDEKEKGRTVRNPAAKFDTGNLALTQNLISALNKLPPHTENAFRHDVDYPGFRELNQVGAVVTEFAFMSTTREANSLKAVDGSGKPEVLTIIKSKTGRFIKPGAFHNIITSDENEVLFKPGTRFKVTKRVAAQEANMIRTKHNIESFNASGGTLKSWPTGMDPELKTALDQDKEKPQVKLIVKKEEV